MGNCAKLKWNRRRLGLSQKAFADKAGVSVGTIAKLEVDETAWGVLRSETEDKIYSMFDSMSSWQPEDFKATVIIHETSDEVTKTEYVEENKQEEVIVQKEEAHSNLTKNDQITRKLIDDICGGLRQTVSHEEFEIYIKMLKGILDKY